VPRARLVILLLGFGVLSWASSSQLGIVLQLVGQKVPASSGKLSEHDLEEINSVPAEAQALRLLEKAVNHYAGAAEEIERRLEEWRGKMQPSKELESLTSTAYFSNDLRVRAMALEIWLARDDVQKTPEAVDALIARAGAADGRQYYRLSLLGILGNRGVEPDKVLRTLLIYVRDPSGEARAAAINGLGLLGTEGTVVPLLERFRWDASADLRERAACNLADSGMLTHEMRQEAVPELIRYAHDESLDAATRKWVFQALREIAGENLPDDGNVWAGWRAARPAR
jgi:HEAT repeat protein